MMPTVFEAYRFVDDHASMVFCGAVLSTVGLFAGRCVVSVVIHRHRRRQWYKRNANLRSLRAMPWQAFERFTGEVFRDLGYTVSETGVGGRDGGIDLLLQKGPKIWLVQCKRFRKQPVGVSLVRELIGTAVGNGADGAIFVTLSKFTRDARNLARTMPVTMTLELVDGFELLRLARTPRQAKARESRDRKKRSGSLENAKGSPQTAPPGSL